MHRFEQVDAAYAGMVLALLLVTIAAYAVLALAI